MTIKILIFKTNADTQEQVQRAAALFKSVLSVKKWSFDLEDCDRVLRVVAFNLQPEMVERLLAKAGITCEHMEYEL